MKTKRMICKECSKSFVTSISDFDQNCRQCRDKNTSVMKDKVLAWLGTGNVGASSKAMALAAVGAPHDGSHPYNPVDFNRCLLLLEAVPEIRNHFAKVADINDTWGNLIGRWEEIEESFLLEVGLDWIKAGIATKTYQLMKDVGC